MGLLHGLRINLGVFKLDEVAFVGSELLRPYGFHRLNIFIGAIAATIVGHAEHAEFIGFARRLGAETDADEQAAVGEVI